LRVEALNRAQQGNGQRKNVAENEAPKATGQFGPGNTAAAGNHSSKRAKAIRQLFSEEITDTKLRLLVAKLYYRAMETPEDGQADIAAARELLDRMFGKVPQAMEHSGPEGAPVRVVYCREDPAKPAEPVA
jgi:hypothetical protein